MVAAASASGSPSGAKPGVSRPVASALASVGRKAAPGGIVRTRGTATAHEAPTASAFSTAASAGAMASGVPTVIQLPRRGTPYSRPDAMAASK